MPRKKKAADTTLQDDTQVEFAHPETGAAYGGTYKTFQERFEPEGFELVKRADDMPIAADVATPKTGEGFQQPPAPEQEEDSGE